MSTKNEFNAKSKCKKRAAPFSLRLTFEERTKLLNAANGVPLGAYIKAVLFDGDLTKVRRRNMNPTLDDAALARILAALGQSRISSNLNQLARAVNTGILPVHPETEEELKEACGEIAAMRADLLRALGKKEGRHDPERK
ncbi:plasmid mobilization relaxosome protein MobC [Leisingera sp. HS039]|uniref:plasmid mobilization relaxosome protein MobC n=1 Tax=unclassified Leisingera TaxID=2614906 RepID=UPI0010714BEC|nr:MULTISPECIES: plasmid mobilization relaxosome protein MobC [unclassified Leisingera]MBQ4826707.1 plasmid mobilization relaxosome protein MobC [Leisingera sp. HS039]QBR37145.1 plasmid mobilization relaxosome protein MobC [Leisingera sp. NJS201]